MASFEGQQDTDESANTSKGLRQPKQETMSRLMNPSVGDNNQVKSSVLSVNAPEFVPRSCSGYKAPVLSASAPEFVPRHMQEVPQFQTEYDPVLEEFRQTISILNTHPGNVEEFMRPLCDKFRHGITNAEQMAEIINELFLQSVEEPNFRYTGARICQHICLNLKDHTIFSTFRNAFLKRCQKEYERREILVTNPDTLDLLTGFTLFMGELFLNLEVHENGKFVKMKILPSILKDLVLTLLSQPSKITIKCTCQLLKLVGSSMEDMMRPMDGSPSPFDEVFTQLHLIMQSNSVDDTSQFLIKSVLNLRQTNWGRPESTSSLDSNSDFNGSLPLELTQNEPVFYNASGQTITREEAGFYSEEIDESGYILNEDEEQAFLEWQAENEMAPNDGYHNDGYVNNWSQMDEHGYMRTGYYGGDDEMDEDAEAAYEEFLQSQMRHHH